MKLLVDTNVLIWWLFALLPARLQGILESREALVRVSSVSIWEAEIKAAAGKLELPGEIVDGARDIGCEELAVTWAHGVQAGRLPLLHRDPFDRMLVAQAQLEGLSIVTADPQIARYDVHVVPAR